jgi:hypothetical protein
MHRTYRVVSSGALAASALVVAACGAANVTTPAGTSQPAASSSSSTQTSSAASTPSTSTSLADACSLITAGEASTALGQNTGAGTSSANGGQCTYTAAAGNITIIATQFPDGSTAGSSFAGTRTAAMGGVPGFQDVTGVGDKAFLTGTGLVEFIKGSVVVMIQTLSSGNPSTSAMTTLGQAAASRV